MKVIVWKSSRWSDNSGHRESLGEVVRRKRPLAVRVREETSGECAPKLLVVIAPESNSALYRKTPTPIRTLKLIMPLLKALILF